MRVRTKSTGANPEAPYTMEPRRTSTILLVVDYLEVENRLARVLQLRGEEVLILRGTELGLVDQAKVLALRRQEVIDTVIRASLYETPDFPPVRFEGTGRKPKRMHKCNRRRGRK